jgi:hypothetical protein
MPLIWQSGKKRGDWFYPIPSFTVLLYGRLQKQTAAQILSSRPITKVDAMLT